MKYINLITKWFRPSQTGILYIDKGSDRSHLMEKPDRQGKCVLCSREIAREPIVRLLNGQRLEFDKGECRLIFDRLVAVYGTSFGFELRDS